MATEQDTRDTTPEQIPDIALKDGVLAVAPTRFEPVDLKMNQAELDALAFMEEEIEIMVQETADENAENPVRVGNQGQYFQFFRGQCVRAKRKFVDCLIVKTGRVATPEYINNAGERARSIRQHSAHKYPFTVIRDNNPKGAEWLRARLSEAV